MSKKTEQELIAEAISDDKAKKAERVFNKLHLNTMDKGRERDIAFDAASERGDYDEAEEQDFQKGADVGKAVRRYGKVRDYAKKHNLPTDSNGNPVGNKERVRAPENLGYEHGMKHFKKNSPGNFGHERLMRNLDTTIQSYQDKAKSDPANAEKHERMATRLRAYQHGWHRASRER